MALPQAVRDILEKTDNDLCAPVRAIEDRETKWEPPPLWHLLVAFGTQEDGGEASALLAFRRRLRLALYAAQRALVCWELYCDGKEPHAAIAAIEAWLASDTRPTDWESLCRPAQPAFREHAIGDCRWADTGSAAKAAACAAQFLRDGALVQAFDAIEYAHAAFIDSPLGEKDHIERWLIEVAASAAYENRDLTPAERDASRDFDAREIPAVREREAHYWNAWLRNP